MPQSIGVILQLDPDLFRRLETLARANGQVLGDQVRQMLEEHLAIIDEAETIEILRHRLPAPSASARELEARVQRFRLSPEGREVAAAFGALYAEAPYSTVDPEP